MATLRKDDHGEVLMTPSDVLMCKTIMPPSSPRNDMAFCSGCFASISQYEMLMCKACRRMYCRKCTGVDAEFIQTQLDRCVICRKLKPHPENVLMCAIVAYGQTEDFRRRVCSKNRDLSMDSVENLLRRICDVSRKTYPELVRNAESVTFSTNGTKRCLVDKPPSPKSKCE